MKHNLVFIGLLFIAAAIFVPFSLSEDGSLKITVDVLPDFLGFIFIYLGLEKMKYRNWILRECGHFAVGFAVFSLLTYIGQLGALLVQGVDNMFFAAAIRLFGSVYTNLEYIILGIYMLFIAVFMFGTAKEVSLRIPFAEKSKKFSWKDEYSEPHFSRGVYKAGNILSYIFAALYAAGGVTYIVCHILGTTLTFLGDQTGIWPIFIPLHILFLFCLNTILQLIRNERPDENGKVS